MDSSVEAHPETMISELDDGSNAQYRNTVILAVVNDPY